MRVIDFFDGQSHRRLPQVLDHWEMSFRAPRWPFTAWVREYPSEVVHPLHLECARDGRLTMGRPCKGCFP